MDNNSPEIPTGNTPEGVNSEEQHRREVNDNQAKLKAKFAEVIGQRDDVEPDEARVQRDAFFSDLFDRYTAFGERQADEEDTGAPKQTYEDLTDDERTKFQEKIREALEIDFGEESAVIASDANEGDLDPAAVLAVGEKVGLPPDGHVSIQKRYNEQREVREIKGLTYKQLISLRDDDEGHLQTLYNELLDGGGETLSELNEVNENLEITRTIIDPRLSSEDLVELIKTKKFPPEVVLRIWRKWGEKKGLNDSKITAVSAYEKSLRSETSSQQQKPEGAQSNEPRELGADVGQQVGDITNAVDRIRELQEQLKKDPTSKEAQEELEGLMKEAPRMQEDMENILANGAELNKIKGRRLTLGNVGKVSFWMFVAIIIAYIGALKLATSGLGEGRQR
jgi:hypothetical protein